MLMDEYFEWRVFASASEAVIPSALAGFESSPYAIA